MLPKKSYKDHIKNNPHWATISSTDGQPLDDRTISDIIIQYKQCKDHVVPENVDQDIPILACELVDKVALSRKSGAYSILTYCAGDPRETDVILVDGIPFNVFANLGHALECTLLAWNTQNPGKELLLWADQICINQQDHAERGAQVAMIRDIYRRSRESFVCLSNPKVEKCLKWTLSVSTAASGHHNSTSELALDPWLNLYIDTSISTQELLSSLKTFISSPLWCRSWIYQELVVAPRPYLSLTRIAYYGQTCHQL